VKRRDAFSAKYTDEHLAIAVDERLKTASAAANEQYSSNGVRCGPAAAMSPKAGLISSRRQYCWATSGQWHVVESTSSSSPAAVFTSQ